jgi:hypothetical protein
VSIWDPCTPTTWDFPAVLSIPAIEPLISTTKSSSIQITSGKVELSWKVKLLINNVKTFSRRRSICSCIAQVSVWNQNNCQERTTTCHFFVGRFQSRLFRGLVLSTSLRVRRHKNVDIGKYFYGDRAGPMAIVGVGMRLMLFPFFSTSDVAVVCVSRQILRV